MHDHKPEVISEGVRDEKPVAAEILKPDLRGLAGLTSVEKAEPPVFDALVHVESGDHLAFFAVADELWFRFLVVRGFAVFFVGVLCAKAGKLEFFDTELKVKMAYIFDFSKSVEVNAAEGEDLVVLQDFPVE